MVATYQPSAKSSRSSGGDAVAGSPACRSLVSGGGTGFRWAVGGRLANEMLEFYERKFEDWNRHMSEKMVYCGERQSRFGTARKGAINTDTRLSHMLTELVI